jgi:hypothetical protein
MFCNQRSHKLKNRAIGERLISASAVDKYDFAPASGAVLQRGNAAGQHRLFDELDAVGGAAVGRIILTSDVGAGAVGGRHRTLRIGLPLLLAMPMEEMRAILAHEVAHLSGAGQWPYRALASVDAMLLVVTRRRWRGVLGTAADRVERLRRRKIVRPLLAASRRAEYTADHHAAERTGSAALASALLRIDVLATAVADFERHYIAKVATRADEHERIGFHRALLQALDAGSITTWTLDARPIEVATQATDTHPSIADRLSALGQAGAQLHEAEPTARALISDEIDAVIAACDAHWTQLNRAALISAGRRRRATAISDPHNDTFEARMTAAKSLWKREGGDMAVAALTTIVQDFPGAARAHFLLGRALLEAGSRDGLHHLARAASLDASAVAPAAEILAQEARSEGDDSKARAHEHASREGLDAYQAAAIAERRLCATVAVLPHRLERETVTELASAGAAVAGLVSLHAVRRPVREWLLQPGLHLIATFAEAKSADPPLQERAAALRATLAPALSGQPFTVTADDGSLAWLNSHFAAHADARIYPPPVPPPPRHIEI